MLKQD
jgi:hypothetical protein